VEELHLSTADLPLINRILLHYPQVADILSIVKRVSGSAKFPLNTFDDLISALGGDQAMVDFGGRVFAVGTARTMIPAYYFPITNEYDFIAKIQDLQQLHGGSSAAPISGESSLNLQPATAPKPVDLEPPPSVDGLLRLAASQPANVAGIIGLPKVQ
jgi:hypothetical protein